MVVALPQGCGSTENARRPVAIWVESQQREVGERVMRRGEW